MVNPTAHPKKYWLKVGLLALLAALLLWTALLVRTALVLRDDVQALQDYASALPNPIEPEAIDLARVAAHVTSIHQNLSTLRIWGAPLLALTPALGWLPEIGGDVRAVPALLDMVLQYTDLADRALQMVTPLWPLPASSGGGGFEFVTRLLQVLQPAMTSLGDNLHQAEDRRESIDTASLSPRLRSMLDRYDSIYPSLDTGLKLAEVAPQLLGADRPRTYLILFQNEDELRPTGGFLSAAGRVTLDAGKILTLTVADSYQLDDFTKPYDEPPAPLLDYMGSQLWLFRDSNWSVDFPTAARKAIELYAYTQTDAIDGVIALNQRVVESLVAALGTLTIDPQQPPLTGQTVRAYMRSAWDPNGQSDLGEWFLHRKDFIGRVMQAVLDRLVNQPAQIDWVKLGRALDDVLRSHDLMIYLGDEKIDRPLADVGWNGAVPHVAGDFLMVVDANLGFDKVNAVIQEAFTYTVSLNANDDAEADVSILYTHTGAAADDCPRGGPGYTIDYTYEKLLQQCYWNYRRVLVPLGSKLIAATRHPTQASELVTGVATDGSTQTSIESGKTVFGTLLIVKRGHQLASEVRYSLPDGIIQRAGDRRIYRLHVQKQSGAGHWPLTIDVTWPSGQRLIDAQPKPTTINDNRVEFQLTLDADIDLAVVFGP
jgi:hypothetical protein